MNKTKEREGKNVGTKTTFFVNEEIKDGVRVCKGYYDDYLSAVSTAIALKDKYPKKSITIEAVITISETIGEILNKKEE